MGNELFDTINVGVFGDSISKGVVLDNFSKRYHPNAYNMDVLKKSNILLENYSMFGCTVSKGLAIVKRHIPKLSNYKFILLEFGGNDCDFDWKEISQNPDIDHIPKTPLEEFERLYTDIVGEIRNNGGNPILLSLPPLDPNRYFNWISEHLNKNNILKWLGDINMIYRWHEAYNLRVATLATKLSVPFIDIRSDFLKNHRYTDFICEDGIHPNLLGHELILKTIAEKLKLFK